MIAGFKVREVGPCKHQRGRGGAKLNCFHEAAKLMRVFTPAPEYLDEPWAWCRSVSGDYRRIPIENLALDF